EALQVAVDDEDEVVELLAGGEGDRPEALRLVRLAVAEERPDAAVAGVGEPAVVQVAVEARLVDRLDGSEAHRHGGELPEAWHQPRVRVGGDAARGLAPEGLELRVADPALEVGTGVDAR